MKTLSKVQYQLKLWEQRDAFNSMDYMTAYRQLEKLIAAAREGKQVIEGLDNKERTEKLLTAAFHQSKHYKAWRAI